MKKKKKLIMEENNKPLIKEAKKLFIDIVMEEILPYVILVAPALLVAGYIINYGIINTGHSSDIARIFLSTSNTVNILINLCLIIFIFLIILFLIILLIQKYITSNKTVLLLAKAIPIILMGYFLYNNYLHDVSSLKVMIKEKDKDAYEGDIIYKNDDGFLIKVGTGYFYYPQERIEYFEFINEVGKQ